MEFLFDNLIANMQGTTFLAIYLGIAFFSVVVFYFVKISIDWTTKLPTPVIPHEIDPFEIAYLRGGENELTRSVVFSLTKKGFLAISNEDKQSFVSQTKIQPNWTELSQIERNVLTYFQVTRETKDLFSNGALTRIISPFALAYKSNAKFANFLMPNDVKSKTRFLAFIFASIIASLGFYKLFVAVLYGSFNIIFLPILLSLTVLIFWLMSKTKRLSALGESYLSQLQTAFDRFRNLKAQPLGNKNQPVMNGIDPTMLAVGLFGTSVLIGSDYGGYEKAFHRSTATSGSGCGSSCGSSCSSGGDGGGSGCGGCGGCS
jgi:uncharacterized protein (TIGR04222 family)